MGEILNFLTCRIMSCVGVRNDTNGWCGSVENSAVDKCGLIPIACCETTGNIFCCCYRLI